MITTEEFFREFVRLAGLLRTILTGSGDPLCSVSARMRARDGARPGPGTALETGARFNPEILIRRRLWPYTQPVRCNWSFARSTGAGSTCASVIRRDNGGCERRWPTVGSKRLS